MQIDDITSRLVSWSLDLSQMQAQVSSRNIANANVEGFQAQRVDFGEQLETLKASLSDPGSLATALGSLDSEGFSIVAKAGGGLFGAPVQLDSEIADLTTANTRYMTLAESLNRHFGLIRLSITGRG